MGASSSHNNDPTLKNCLFVYCLLFKTQILRSIVELDLIEDQSFSFPSSGFGQNVLIFGVDMSASAHIDNKKKNLLVLGKGPTQWVEHTLTAEKMTSINFTATKKKFCLSLHYNKTNSYLFFNGIEI